MDKEKYLMTDSYMTVRIWLKETAQPLVYFEVENAYTKGDLYCVFIREKNIIYKYPLSNIWRIEESYS